MILKSGKKTMKWHKENGIWKKILWHDWYTITDERDMDTYRVDIYFYRTFSFKDGFMYLVQAPDMSFCGKKLFPLISALIRSLYLGNVPCYYRLREELMNKGLWSQL